MGRTGSRPRWYTSLGCHTNYLLILRLIEIFSAAQKHFLVVGPHPLAVDSGGLLYTRPIPSRSENFSGRMHGHKNGGEINGIPQFHHVHESKWVSYVNVNFHLNWMGPTVLTVHGTKTRWAFYHSAAKDKTDPPSCSLVPILRSCL